MANIELKKCLKGFNEHNPVMTHNFGADPYAITYNGRVYLYMTGDDFIYDESGNIKENNYSNIWQIRVVSSDDLVNWTDHGSVYAASDKGHASWGNNSWAPAATYKIIDGKPKFFLYFANSGNGIAVLSADSPVGPFTDPINGPLISRATPTCAEVTWLFDPAVLMDDDGKAYIYFGGGVPSPDKASNPGTARVAKLADDMISLDGDPVAIENVAYLFEDSGINKINGKYIYSYCSNFNVPEGGAPGMGFDCGEIITMVSDAPMGPFEYKSGVLKNPSFFFGRGGNNHHCMFEFEGKWYMSYHARLAEEKMGVDAGYRSTNIDEINFDENGDILPIKGTREGVKQLKNVDPKREIAAVTMANQAGIDVAPYGKESEEAGYGNMILTGMTTGSWTMVSGVDFGSAAPKNIEGYFRGVNDGTVHVRIDAIDGDDVAVINVNAAENFIAAHADFNKSITGVHDVFFVFEGEGYQFEKWCVEV